MEREREREKLHIELYARQLGKNKEHCMPSPVARNKINKLLVMVCGSTAKLIVSGKNKIQLY